MGATWKYETMFGSSFLEDNFESLLNSHGIETYAIDYEKDETFVDVVNACRDINVDYVMGYSLGCFLALAYPKQTTKGIILLDPQSIVDHSQKKYIEDIHTANKFFDNDIQNKNHAVSSTLDFSLIKPVHQKTMFLFSEYGKVKNSLMDPKNIQFRTIPNKKTVVIPNSSHYIMLEPARFDAANAISDFINE
jgi:pimeloyl-ACP methyl ester carboxylesterase